MTADLTLTFGAVKRGHLIARDTCGTIVVLDIGLDAARRLERAALGRRSVGRRAASADRGGRAQGNAKEARDRRRRAWDGRRDRARRARRAAQRHRNGEAHRRERKLAPVQEAEPQALLPRGRPTTMRFDATSRRGRTRRHRTRPRLGPESEALLEARARRWTGPTLLDADAITLFGKRRDALPSSSASDPRSSRRTRRVRAARRRGAGFVLAHRFEIGAALAKRTGADGSAQRRSDCRHQPRRRATRERRRNSRPCDWRKRRRVEWHRRNTARTNRRPVPSPAPPQPGSTAAPPSVRRRRRRQVRGLSLDDVVRELRESWSSIRGRRAIRSSPNSAPGGPVDRWTGGPAQPT